MNTVASGLEHFIAGFTLIRAPGLKKFVIVPLLINILLFIGLFFLLRHYMTEFNQWFDAYLPHWLQWLHVVLWLVFFGCFVLIVTYGFVTIANIVCAPFNAFLAEQVALYLTGHIQAPRTLSQILKDIPRSFGRQLSILGYYLPRALLIFCLLFVPVVQGAVAIIWFLFHAWFMTLTYIDYPTDNAQVSMREVRGWLAGRRWAALGFGIGVLVASMVPVLNFFTIPAAVAGATQFWIKEQ